MRSTAPKSGKDSAVKEIRKSGSIPILIRVSQMLTLTSRKGKYSSSDEETLTETSGEDGEKNNGKANVDDGKQAIVITKEISPPMTLKAERLMGIKPKGIYVRRDVDVESVASRDERGLVVERLEGKQERW